MSTRAAIRHSRNTLPAFAAQGVFWGCFGAYAPVLKAGIGASDAQFGYVLLMSAIGAVTAMWLAPLFSARFGRYAMALAAIILAIAFQLPMQTDQVWVFGAMMFFVGAGSGLLDVVMNAHLSLIESRTRTSLMNLNHAGFSFAYAGAAIIAGLSREASLSPAVVFAGFGAAVVICAASMIEPVMPEGGEVEEQRDTTKLPTAVIWGGMIIFAAFLTENATEGWSALHIERTLGGGASEGALGPAMLGLTMAFGRLGGQLVSARFPEARVLFYAALLSASGAFLASIAPSPLVANIGFAILGLGVSVIAPMAFVLVGRRVTDQDRAKAISRAAVIGYLGFFFGPPIMGGVAELAGLRWSFVFVAAVLGAVPLFLWMLRRTERVSSTGLQNLQAQTEYRGPPH
ncbi:MFS transporter [Aliiroseovarius sp. YM-037]|uniref:MFS transporter n=1 Tax=Aliiroseovarius sp. YM-037 TaxID=3341728 RepID=UPI003A80DC21